MACEMKSCGHHDNLIYRDRRGNRPNKSSSRDRVMQDAEIEGRRQPCCSADIEMQFFHPEGGETPTAKSVASDRSSRSSADSLPSAIFPTSVLSYLVA